VHRDVLVLAHAATEVDIQERILPRRPILLLVRAQARGAVEQHRKLQRQFRESDGSVGIIPRISVTCRIDDEEIQEFRFVELEIHVGIGDYFVEETIIELFRGERWIRIGRGIYRPSQGLQLPGVVAAEMGLSFDHVRNI